MHEINYTDRSFQQESASEYALSLQANSNGLAYTVCDNTSNQIILFKRHRFEQVILLGDLIRNINDVLASDPILGLPFSTIRYLAYTRQTTLVPETFYDPQSIREYLAFNNAGDTDGDVFSNLIAPQGIFNIFSLPSEIVSLITTFFKNAEFLNQTTPFLKHIFVASQTFHERSVYLGLNPDFFDIACLSNGKLLLYNTFQYTSETDLLYYVLYVYNQVQFKPESDPLLISGELGSKLSYLDILKQYFAQTTFDEKASGPKIASGIRHLNISRFLNLLNVNVCESSAVNTGEEK